MLKLVFFLLNLAPLLCNLFLPHLPFLVHPFCPLLGCLSGLAAILRLGENAIGLEGMIFFELLIEQCFLFKFLTLLRLVIVMQASECLLCVLFGGGLASLCGDTLRVEGALPQFDVIFERFQTLQILALGLGMFVKTVAELIFVIVVQILAFDQ